MLSVPWYLVKPATPVHEGAGKLLRPKVYFANSRGGLLFDY